MPKIAFLGAGNMAGAILRGLIAAAAIAPKDAAVLAGTGKSAPELAAGTGARLAKDLPDLLAGADAFVLACKPQHFSGLDAGLASLTAGKLVVSVLAGTPLSRLREKFPGARVIVRMMPNTPGRIGAGMTPFTPEFPLDDADAELVDAMLGALGSSIEIPESKMDAVIAGSGSTPGWFFEIVAAFEEGAVAAGLSRVEAQVLVRSSFIGSARLLEATGEEPEALRNAVTSPNGTTFAGLQYFASHDLRGIVAGAQAACVARAKELAKA